MKHFETLLSLILACFTVWSCNDSASFETSHPSDGEVLTSIPEALEGRYLAIDNDSELLVKDFSVADIYKANASDAMHIDTLHSELNKQELNVIERNEQSIKVKLDEEFIIDIRIEGDSAYFDFEIPDVIFSINQGDALIKKGSFFYFNVKREEGDFMIRRVTFEEDGLLMENLVSSDSIRQLLAVHPDSTTKNLVITAGQFDVLEKKGFKEKRRYKRISE